VAADKFAWWSVSEEVVHLFARVEERARWRACLRRGGRSVDGTKARHNRYHTSPMNPLVNVHPRRREHVASVPDFTRQSRTPVDTIGGHGRERRGCFAKVILHVFAVLVSLISLVTEKVQTGSPQVTGFAGGANSQQVRLGKCM
jgi:hypothetical protein